MRRMRMYTMTILIALLAQLLSAAGVSAAGEVPAVSSMLPADGATSVPANGRLLLTFANPVQKGTGKITIKNSTTFDTAAEYNVTGSAVSLIQPNVAMITPEANALQPNTDYYVQVSAGAFVSAASGNAFAGITDTQTWNFHTVWADGYPPTALSLTPTTNSNISDLSGALTIKFSEPVIPGSGKIVIKDLSSGSTYSAINASNAGYVSGIGTDTITVRSQTAFKTNMVYAVQIENNAFTDMSGNSYAGIASTDTTTWRFTTSSDTTPPELTSISPDSGANFVPLNGPLKITFNESVRLTAGVKAVAIPTSGSSASVPLSLSLDTSVANGDTVLLTPDSALVGSTGYIVNIPNTAIADLAGNYYPGILNDYRWAFSTLGSDRTAPSLSGVTTDGSVILLTYSEPLDESSVPYASNYYVTVNEVPRQVNAVAVSGSQVKLTLQSGVTVGQTVKVSYTLGDRPLRDRSTNNALAFNNVTVSNTADTTLPKPVSGTVNSYTLTLTFNKSLQSMSAFASGQFTVKVNGSATSFGSVSASGSTVTINLPYTVSTGQSVSVSYTPGAYPLLDTSGNSVAAFADFYVQNSSDTAAPTLSSATVSGATLTLNYNEGLNASTVPLKSSFSVLVNGSANPVTGVSVTNNQVVLNLTLSVSSSNVVSVTYIKGNPAISDLAGNAAAGFSNYQVISNSSATATLSSATVSGSSLKLAYSTSLNTSSVPYALQFVVKADGNFVNVNSVSISGSTVVLALGSAVKQGQVVTLTYYNSGTPLLDAGNQKLAALEEIAVTNQSSSVDNLPGATDTDESGGLTLDAAAATKTAGITPSGQSAARYNIDGEKLIQAFAAVKTNSAQLAKPQVTFTVPSTEAGALISIPISSMMTASEMASNGVFRLKYGATTFELPLSAVNYSEQMSILGGNWASANLYMAIEKATDSTLTSAITAKGAQLLASPVNFTVSISSGGAEREVKTFEGFVTRTFELAAGAASSAELSVVRYDSQFGELSYVPTTTETSGGTLSVRFMRKSNSVYAVVRKSKTVYSDMTSHWAKSDVAALAAKFIVDGPTNATFAPNKNVTRAEFAEFLAKGLGLNGDASAAAKYKDVTPSGSTTAYIGAVSSAGIVQGDANGKFNPNASITREEMATMMLRAMSYAGVQPSSSSSALSRFSDRGKVSAWANSAVSANITAGIMAGVSATEFQPKANASRAQAAVMIKRCLEYVELFEGN